MIVRNERREKKTESGILRGGNQYDVEAKESTKNNKLWWLLIVINCHKGKMVFSYIVKLNGPKSMRIF